MNRPRVEFQTIMDPGVTRPRWLSVAAVEDRRMMLARVEVAPGSEHWFAAALFELVKLGAVDVAAVRHWFELCEKGDGPKVSK